MSGAKYKPPSSITLQATYEAVTNWGTVSLLGWRCRWGAGIAEGTLQSAIVWSNMVDCGTDWSKGLQYCIYYTGLSKGPSAVHITSLYHEGWNHTGSRSQALGDQHARSLRRSSSVEDLNETTGSAHSEQREWRCREVKHHSVSTEGIPEALVLELMAALTIGGGTSSSLLLEVLQSKKAWRDCWCPVHSEEDVAGLCPAAVPRQNGKLQVQI